jgi:hypothetical protein
VTARLDAAAIDRALDARAHFTRVDAIIDRVFATAGG